MSLENNLVVSCETAPTHIKEQALTLARSLNLPFQTEDEWRPKSPLLLFVSENGIDLRQYEPKKAQRPLIHIDFVHGANGYRFRHNRTIHQPLAKAVGVKPGFRPDILDGTAGLGGDGFVLACLGCRVTLVERSPIIGVLLQDGLHRAEKKEDYRSIIRDKITLVVEDSNLHMTRLTRRPHTIYLDPMYPHRKKSALNKIEMRLLRQLVGNDLDSSILLQTALRTASNRVVVKRPKGAPTIDVTGPTYTLTMKNSRFDVYLVGS